MSISLRLLALICILAGKAVGVIMLGGMLAGCTLRERLLEFANIVPF